MLVSWLDDVWVDLDGCNGWEPYRLGWRIENRRVGFVVYEAACWRRFLGAFPGQKPVILEPGDRFREISRIEGQQISLVTRVYGGV